MFVSDFDGAWQFVMTIRLHKQQGEKNQREKHPNLAKASADMVYTVSECFCYFLQDKLCKEYPGKGMPMIGVHHVNMVLLALADIPNKDVTTDVVMKILKEVIK